MRAYTAVIERCSDTGLYVGFVPGFPGAHSQAESLDELKLNLQEVLSLLLEDDPLEFVLHHEMRPPDEVYLPIGTLHANVPPGQA